MELDPDTCRIKGNKRIKYVGHLVPKLLSGHTMRHTYKTGCSIWAMEVVGKNTSCADGNN